MAPEFVAFFLGFLIGGALVGTGVGVVVKYISKQEVKITYTNQPRVIRRTEEEEADLEATGESGAPGRDFSEMRMPQFMKETGEDPD